MALGISKSSYYYRARGYDRRRRPLDPELMADIENLSGYELAYGYRKVTAKLMRYNHKKVLRHTQAMDRTQPRRYKRKERTHLPAVCPIQSNVRWETDLTYVFDGTRNTYLFAVLDVYDKEVVGDEHGLRCRADEALVSMKKAVWNRFGMERVPDGVHVTLRIDQGTQYLAKKFREGAAALGVHLEYCGINCPNEKPFIESFYAQYKREEVYRHEYRCFGDAVDGWRRYRHFYNTERLHEGLDMRTIPEFKEHDQSRRKTAHEDGPQSIISDEARGMVPPVFSRQSPGDLHFVATFQS